MKGQRLRDEECQGDIFTGLKVNIYERTLAFSGFSEMYRFMGSRKNRNKIGMNKVKKLVILPLKVNVYYIKGQLILKKVDL